MTDQYHARQTHFQRSRALCNSIRPYQNGGASTFRSARYFTTSGFRLRLPLQVIRDQRLQGPQQHADASRPATVHLVQRDGRPQRWILSALAHQGHGADRQLPVQGHLLHHGRMSWFGRCHYNISVQSSLRGSKWRICLLLGKFIIPLSSHFLRNILTSDNSRGSTTLAIANSTKTALPSPFLAPLHLTTRRSTHCQIWPSTTSSP